MAKMTKTEKREKELMATQAAWNEFRASYPERFAALMYEYLTLGQQTMNEGVTFKVEKLGWNQYLFQGEVGYPVEAQLYVILPEAYQPDYVWQFECVERVAQEYHEQVAEVARQAEVRRAAMEKLRLTLTDEEITLLGIG